MNSKFIIDGASVIEVVEIGDDLLAPAQTIFKRGDYDVYDTRLDARYHSMLRDLQNGKSIYNYKSSKYYKYYIERLKEENPEYII